MASAEVEQDSAAQPSRRSRPTSRRPRTAAGFASLLTSVGVVWALLAGCTDSDTSQPLPRRSRRRPCNRRRPVASRDPEAMHVRVLGLWSGPEFDSFVTVKSAWEQNTGGTVEWQGAQDLPGELDAQIEAGTPPDIAILPNIGLMHELADEGQLVALPSVMDMDQLQTDYAPAWIDLGSHDDELYGIFYKVTNKSTVWYNPKAFAAADYGVPSTWDEMIGLADTMVADGRTPFSVVAPIVPGGGGWALTDWISQIVLNTCGPDSYDQWVAGQIPWTDACIKQSFDMFVTIVQTPGYVLGGSERHPRHERRRGVVPDVQRPADRVHVLPRLVRPGVHRREVPPARSGRRLRLLPVPHHQPRRPSVGHHRRRRRGHVERHPRSALVHDLPRRCRVATGMDRTRRLHLRQPQRRSGRVPRPGGSGGGRRAGIGRADPFRRGRHDAGVGTAGMVARPCWSWSTTRASSTRSSTH